MSSVGGACLDPQHPAAACSDAAEVVQDAAEQTEEVDDGYEAPPPATARAIEHPLGHLSADELEKRYLDDPASLGSMSLGSTNAGALLNAVRMPESDHWELLDPNNAWGTEETVQSLAKCIDGVHELFADTPRVAIGHISSQRGGHLSPHVSHQAGRDVDLAYFLTGTPSNFQRATAKNLDRPRTWALVRSLFVDTDVELVLIDHSVQKLLREYALEAGEDPVWLAEIFEGGNGRAPIIRHAKGHGNHMHIRFFSPIARETAVRALPFLTKRGKAPVAGSYVEHTARAGDTLGRLAARYGTSVRAIQAANGLKSTSIRAKQRYRIPRSKGIAPPSGPIVVPPRRPPPERDR